MNESKQINVNSASIVDLKAELYRKQETFRLKKLSQSQQQVVENDTNLYDINSNQIKYKLGKRIRDKNDREVIANKRKYGSKPNEDKVTKLTEEDIEVEKALQKSREMLEIKSKLYDKLTKNPNLLNKADEDSEDETDERILVDFHQKAADIKSRPITRLNEDIDYQKRRDDEEEEEEWTEFVDSLGRSRKCLKKDLHHYQEMDRKTFGPKKSEDISNNKLDSSDLSTVPHLSANNELLTDDLRRELERREWETNARNEVTNERQSEGLKSNNLNIHYQNVQNNEIRDHGVAYYAFAEDQRTRQQQMDLLQDLRDQTVTRKQQKLKLKQKRKQLMNERLAKVAQRKGIAFEPKESSSESEDLSDIELPVPEPKHIPTTVREWDFGKKDLPDLKPKSSKDSYKHYIDNQRDERINEFAPPSSYNEPKKYFRDKRTDLKSHKTNFRQNTEQTNSSIGSDFNDINVNYSKNSVNLDSKIPKQDVNQAINNALSFFRNNLKQ